MSNSSHVDKYMSKYFMSHQMFPNDTTANKPDRYDQAGDSTPPQNEVTLGGDTPTATLSFSAALMLIKGGQRLQREGWNGEGQYVKMHHPHSIDKMTLPYIYIHTVQGDLVPWLCSQTDMLANDWQVVR